MRVEPAQLDQLLHPQFDKNADYDVLARGLNASPGAAVGEVVFSAADAVQAAAEGRQYACSFAGRPPPTTWPA